MEKSLARVFTIVFRDGQQLRIRGEWIHWGDEIIQVLVAGKSVGVDFNFTVGAFKPQDVLMVYAEDFLVDGPA